MVQEFFVLNCCACNFFQVHIIKKSKTWVCKLCNSKQSLIKVYGQGSAKECRLHVQKLNQTLQSKHEMLSEEEPSDTVSRAHKMDIQQSHQQVYEDRCESRTFGELLKSPTVLGTSSRKSKWSAYLDEEEHSEESHAYKKVKQDYDDENESLVCNRWPNPVKNQNSRNSLVKFEENSLPTPLLRKLLELPDDDSIKDSTKSQTVLRNEAVRREDFEEKNYSANLSRENDSLTEKTKNNVSKYSQNGNSHVANNSRLFSMGTDDEDIDSILDL